ncbi:hypothetical protein [Streptomyces sp. NPDC057115]|uniref:hypothetical protein n=1 Tax=unclassified Streptomyces TaxID=2593676 RepID=UPI00363F2976
MTDHDVRPERTASHPGDARDLRLLLEAVADALTLPFDTPNYERRLAERAAWAETVVRVALDGNPAEIGWNADFLRSKSTQTPADTTPQRGERR